MFGLWPEINVSYAMDEALSEAIIDVMDEWFWAIEDGSANQRTPDLDGRRFSEQECDELIHLIDDYSDAQLALGWGKNKGIDVGPGFERLEGSAREAFTQDVYRVCAAVAPAINMLGKPKIYYPEVPAVRPPSYEDIIEMQWDAMH